VPGHVSSTAPDKPVANPLEEKYIVREPDGKPGGVLLEAAMELAERAVLKTLTTEEKLALLRRAWAVALASPKEGWGLTNVEAEACGTPVVASNSPGIRESVRDGETGFLVPHGDVDALAAAFRRLSASRDLVSSMGMKARGLAETFTWTRAADQTEAHLMNAIHPGGCR
jgi:glycosyltransferase involved in cell wall biosynthesis